MAPRCDPVVNWLAMTVRELQAEVKMLHKYINQSEKATVISLFDALHQEAMSLQGQASNQDCALFADGDVQADALSLEPVKSVRSDSLKLSAVLSPAQQTNTEETIDKPDEAPQDIHAIDAEVAAVLELNVYDCDPEPIDSSDEDSYFVEDVEELESMVCVDSSPRSAMHVQKNGIEFSNKIIVSLADCLLGAESKEDVLMREEPVPPNCDDQHEESITLKAEIVAFDDGIRGHDKEVADECRDSLLLRLCDEILAELDVRDAQFCGNYQFSDDAVDIDSFIASLHLEDKIDTVDADGAWPTLQRHCNEVLAEPDADVGPGSDFADSSIHLQDCADVVIPVGDFLKSLGGGSDPDEFSRTDFDEANFDAMADAEFECMADDFDDSIARDLVSSSGADSISVDKAFLLWELVDEDAQRIPKDVDGNFIQAFAEVFTVAAFSVIGSDSMDAMRAIAKLVVVILDDAWDLLQSNAEHPTLRRKLVEKIAYRVGDVYFQEHACTPCH